MGRQVDICLTSSLPLGDLVARIALEGGDTCLVVLRAGRFSGPVPGRAARLQLTGLPGRQVGATSIARDGHGHPRDSTAAAL